MFRKLYDNFEEYMCATLCAGMILCLTLQVCIRAISGSALAWTEELSRYCFIWTVYIGMSLATKKVSQVRITAQLFWASPQVKLAFRVVTDCICVVFNLLIAWIALEVVRENYEFPEISPTLGIVKANVEMIIPCSFLLTTWRIVEQYVRHYGNGTLLELVQQSEEVK